MFESDPTSWTLAAPFRDIPVESELGAGISLMVEASGTSAPGVIIARNSSAPDQIDRNQAGKRSHTLITASVEGKGDNQTSFQVRETANVTSSGNSTHSSATPVYADYVPGNEEVCRRILDRAVQDDPGMFTSGEALVKLRPPNRAELPDQTFWPDDIPGQMLATTADVMKCAERIYWRQPAGGKGGPRMRRTHPPRAFVSDYLMQERGQYGARPLAGIARTPHMNDVGEVRHSEGYDQETGLYHDKNPMLQLPECPSQDDARCAALELLKPFSQYTFEDESSGPAMVLAAIFTSIERPFIPTSPMLVARSSMPGTGKGLLVKALTRLAYDAPPVMITFGGNKEEFEKRFSSVVMNSPAALLIDNANGKQIEGDLVESLLTEGTANIRILGRSETVKVRNRSFITLTGNNPIITGDMARRTFSIDILPRSTDPERDVYEFDPVDFVRAHRIELLRHAYTVMRAFRIAGMPQHGLPAVGSFTAWSRRVRDMVYWITNYDISEAFRRNKSEDPRRQNDAALLSALYDHFGGRTFKSAEPIAAFKSVQDSRRSHFAQPPVTASEQQLADALEEVFSTAAISPKLFGQWARRIQKSHNGGFTLVVQHDSATNANVCTVRRS